MFIQIFKNHRGPKVLITLMSIIETTIHLFRDQHAEFPEQ